MKIEVLYFEGCPNHESTVKRVKDVIDELGIVAEIVEVEISGPEDAVARRFHGSPSVHVDGVDIDPEARDRTNYGYACRTYGGEGDPPRGLIIAALTDSDLDDVRRGKFSAVSRASGSEHRGLLLSGGAIAAAIVASACCWLPLTLVAFGMSAGGLGAMFAKTRILFFGIAAAFLAVGFYFAYVRKEKCAPGSACESPNPKVRRVNRIGFWVAAAGLIVFGLFPNYVGYLSGNDASAAMSNAQAATSTLTLGIEGMSCKGCAGHVRIALMKVPGVLEVIVLYDEKQALVTSESDAQPPDEQLIGAVEVLGYTATIE